MFASIVLLAIAVVAYIWFGVFNVSANDKHWAITTSLIEIVRNRSIATRSGDINIPDITSNELIIKGAPNYAAMCAQCHLAPGVNTSELNAGLNPQPPDLTQKSHSSHSPNETFWIIQNGIKMTGMPAWGKFHSDEQIWELVAFVNVLPKLSKSEYVSLVGDGKHTHDDVSHKNMNDKDADKSKHEHDGHLH